jgi:hypothetical protein
VSYTRRTRDVWVLMQYTGSQYGAKGWEDVTAELERSEIRDRKREYQENQPGAYRIRKTRERIEQPTS